MVIKAKLPGDVMELRKEQKLCDLMVYFERPDLYMFADMTYTQFFKDWDYSYTLPARFDPLGKYRLLSNHYISASNVISAPDFGRSIFMVTRFIRSPLYVYRRLKPDSHIVRMGMVHVSAGEIWFLRILLLNCAAFSYEALRYVDGFEHLTFQAAAVARGLVIDLQEAYMCYDEARAFRTPFELRMLFASLTLQGFATGNIYSDVNCRESMMTDLIDRCKLFCYHVMLPDCLTDCCFYSSRQPCSRKQRVAKGPI
jgi:hypothetical protein